ncbi:hypothetical protein [Flavobacterium sp.]|uniref:hypothetical protein n=1 Tax=Flavobacterium sp. TaxID=239 RepID=UPI0039E59F78
MTFKQRYENLKKELLDAGATIEYEDAGMAMTEGMRDYYRDDENFSIPDDLFELFASIDGLDFRWSLATEAGNLSGFFQLHSLESLLDNETEDKLYADWYEEDDIETIKKHRIFESFEGMDYYTTILFDQGNDYALYYVPDDGVNHGGSKELPKLPLTIAQYVELIFAYYGTYDFRHHLHEPEFYGHPEKFVPQYDLLKKTFPNFNPPQFNPFQ